MAIAAQQSSNVAPFDSDQRSLPAFRTPPHNYEAEKALLGAILANNNAYDRVSDFLRPEHFADGIHGRVYGALAKLIERNQIADDVTLRNFFENDGSFADIGGVRYLAELTASMVSIINVGDYGRLIYDLHLKRQLIELGEQIVNRAFSPEIEDAAEVQIAKAEETLYELGTTGEMERGRSDPVGGGRLQARRPAVRRLDRLPRHRQSAGRPASLRPGDHRGAAQHG
jgi:replicative DNA helicase